MSFLAMNVKVNVVVVFFLVIVVFFKLMNKLWPTEIVKNDP